MWPFKCMHPARALRVYSHHTTSPCEGSTDFEVVTYHLQCLRCEEHVDISCAMMIGGIDAYIARLRSSHPKDQP